MSLWCNSKNKDFSHYLASGKNNHCQNEVLLQIQNKKTKFVTSDWYYTLQPNNYETELFIVLSSNPISFHLKLCNIVKNMTTGSAPLTFQTHAAKGLSRTPALTSLLGHSLQACSHDIAVSLYFVQKPVFLLQLPK